MKKIIFVFITFFCIQSAVFSQDFYIGSKVGLKQNKILNVFKGVDLASAGNITMPTVQILFRTTFLKKWEIETSIGWYNYSQKIKAKIDSDIAFFALGYRGNDVKVLSTSQERLYGSVFISPKAGYRFTLLPELHLRLNTGLQLGLMYNARSTSSTLVESDPFEMYIIYRGVQKPYLNLHISNSVSLQYTTKFNMYFSIFAAYHVGLFEVYQSEIYLVNRKSSESFFYSGKDNYMALLAPIKGSYFEFGIELGYTWKKKQNKKINNE